MKQWFSDIVQCTAEESGCSEIKTNEVCPMNVSGYCRSFQTRVKGKDIQSVVSYLSEFKVQGGKNTDFRETYHRRVLHRDTEMHGVFPLITTALEISGRKLFEKSPNVK